MLRSCRRGGRCRPRRMRRALTMRSTVRLPTLFPGSLGPPGIFARGSLGDEGPLLADFNGPQTVAAKAEYAIEKGLGGVFFWEAGQDSGEGEASLLSAAWVIADTLEERRAEIEGREL